MTDTLLRVVKVGGSLFDYNPLVPALHRWLADQPPAWNVLLAGGGALADAIRAADERYRLGDATAHWLCVDAMGITSQLLAAMLRQIPLETDVTRLRQMLRKSSTGCVVFCPVQFLKQEAAQHVLPRLPCNWTVTSDSIAARVAEHLGADELVLLKSAEPPNGPQRAGRYVDEAFPQASRGIAIVRMVNLRSV